MHALIQEFAYAIRRLVNLADLFAQLDETGYVSSNSGINASTMSDLRDQILGSREMVFLYTVTRQPAYLTRALVKSSEMMVAYARRQIIHWRDILVLSMLSFLLALVGLMVFIVRPYLRKLDHEIHQTRTTLAILPDQIMVSIDSIRKFMKQCDQESLGI